MAAYGIRPAVTSSETDWWTTNQPAITATTDASLTQGATLPRSDAIGSAAATTGQYGDVQSATGTMDPEIIKRAIHDAGIAQGRSEADLAATADRDNAYWVQQIQAKGGLSQYWLDRLKGGNTTAGAGAGAGGYDTGSFATAPVVDLSKDPGYLARMQMGKQAIEGAAAARGALLGGGTLKALERYGQDYGSNEYGKAYDRARGAQGDYWSRLQDLYRGGQQATQGTYVKP